MLIKLNIEAKMLKKKTLSNRWDMSSRHVYFFDAKSWIDLNQKQ